MDIASGILGDFQIDEHISLLYSFGGVLCKLVDERAGIDGIKKLLHSDESKEGFFHVLGGSIGREEGELLQSLSAPISASTRSLSE